MNSDWWHSLAEMTEEEFETNGCVRVFHMYIRTHGHRLSVSNLYVGEKIARDRYAVAVLKGEEIVGHVPRYMSIACSLFMR